MTSGKFLIIPDVHGRTFWKCAKDNVDKFDKIIFLGDYLDPYSEEGINFDEALNNFLEILEFKKENKDKVILLKGNHDMHYVDLNFMDCSRLNYAKRDEVHNIFEENKELFSLIYKYEDILFSHAGIYKDWINFYGLTLEDLLSPNFYSKSALEACSIFRGGNAFVGSCIWADIREFYYQNLIEGYFQVVGHTQLQSNPYITPDIACLDVRRPFVLDVNTKKITEF